MPQTAGKSARSGSSLDAVPLGDGEWIPVVAGRFRGRTERQSIFQAASVRLGDLLTNALE